MNTSFSKIIGNESLKSLLKNHILNKTLSHAYIIEGPKNSGKKTFAKEICKALNCENKSAALPCNCCKACNRIDEGYDTDIYYVSRGEKASIAVEDIRTMTATLGYYPDDGDVKIYIIDEAEKMTIQAQNALLLSLEEPPEYVFYLLLCEDSAQLLETVRSRAQTLKTELFEPGTIAEFLRNYPKTKNMRDKDIDSAAAMSRGALGNALDILVQRDNSNTKIDTDARRFIELMCSDRRSDAIIFASNLKYTRIEYEYFFDSAVFALRDLLAIKYDCDNITFYDDTQSAEALSSRLKIRRIISLYNAFLEAKEDICQNNVTPNTVMITLATDVV